MDIKRLQFTFPGMYDTFTDITETDLLLDYYLLEEQDGDRLEAETSLPPGFD